MHSTKPQKWQTYAEVITCERRCVTHDTSITQSVGGAPTEGLFGDSLSHMKRQTECLTVRSLDACEAVPSLFTCPLHFHRPGLTTIPRTHSLANLHTESSGAMRDLSVADIRKSAGKPERFVIFDFANFYSKNAWKLLLWIAALNQKKKNWQWKSAWATRHCSPRQKQRQQVVRAPPRGRRRRRCFRLSRIRTNPFTDRNNIAIVHHSEEGSSCMRCTCSKLARRRYSNDASRRNSASSSRRRSCSMSGKMSTRTSAEQ